MTDTCAEEMGPPKPANLALEKRGATTFLGRFWGELTVLVLAIVLWLPRLTGPIDLRWDAGVYYLLGTSLATGQGYRILSRLPRLAHPSGREGKHAEKGLHALLLPQPSDGRFRRLVLD